MTDVEKNAVAATPAPKSAKLPGVEKRYTKIEVEECIRRHCGIVTSICVDLDCTVNQFWRAVTKYNLGEAVTEAKKSLVSYAESALLDALKNGDAKTRLDAAKFVLNKMKSAARDWAVGNGDVSVEVKSDGELTINTIFGLPAPEDVG